MGCWLSFPPSQVCCLFDSNTLPIYRTQLHFFLVLNPVAFSNHLASASHAWKTLLWNIQTNMAWSENFLFDQHGMVKETACNVGDCPAASQTAWDVPGTAHMITKDLLKFLKLFHSTRQIPFGREWFGPTEEALSPNITNQKFFRPKCRTDRMPHACSSFWSQVSLNQHAIAICLSVNHTCGSASGASHSD